jgi:hypothetical protein
MGTAAGVDDAFAVWNVAITLSDNNISTTAAGIVRTAAATFPATPAEPI